MRVMKLCVSLMMASVILLGCQQKVEYMTPEIKGQVLDRQTNLPVSDIKVFLTSGNNNVTEEDGIFLISPIVYRYRVSPPKFYEYGAYSDASLMFMSDNYILKSYSLGDLPNTNEAQDKKTSDVNVKRYVNMGKVYLTPIDPNVSEHQEEYIEGPIKYCLPNQSQKEVECIPLPKNMTYDQVH